MPSSDPSRPVHFTLPTTPTTVVHATRRAAAAFGTGGPRLPRPGKNRSAHARSTTTTSSREENSSSSRPRSSGRPTVLKNCRRHRHPGTDRLILAGRCRVILEIEVVPVAAVARRPAVGERGRFDARQRRQPLERPIPERLSVGVPGIARAGQRHRGREHALRVDADADAAEPIETRHHEHGGDDERRRERELGRDERATQPSCALARRSTSARRIGARDPSAATSRGSRARGPRET